MNDFCLVATHWIFVELARPTSRASTAAEHPARGGQESEPADGIRARRIAAVL